MTITAVKKSPSASSSMLSFPKHAAPNPATSIAQAALRAAPRDSQMRLPGRIYPQPFNTPAKAQSYSFRLLKWMTNSRPAVWGLKGLRWSILGHPSQSHSQEIDRQVDALSGSQHMSIAIRAMAPQLAKQLQKFLVESQQYAELEAFLTAEQGSLQMLIETLLPVVYINVATRIQKESPQTHKAVSIADIVSYLYKLANRHLPTINAQIGALREIEDPSEREKKINKLFEPLAKDFLIHAFPAGTYGLPLRILSKAFLCFYKSAHIIEKKLPSLFANLYFQLTLPLNTPYKAVLKATPGGEGLVSLAESSSQKCAEGLATLCTWPEGTASAPPFIHMVVESLNELLTGSDTLKKWLSSWLGKQLAAFGSNSEDSIKLFRGYICSYLEPLLLHVFCHLANISIPAPEIQGRLPDIFGIITIKLLAHCGRFFNQHEAAIKERLESLESWQINPENDDELQRIFTLLAKEILALMGLEKDDPLPLPNFLKGFIIKNLHEQAPKLLLKQYLCLRKNQGPVEARKKLRMQLFDPMKLKQADVAIQVVSALHAERTSLQASMAEKFDQALWQSSGTEKVAQIVEGFCAGLAHDIVEGLMNYLGVNAQTALNDKNSIFMQQARSYFKVFIESLIMETIVHVIETTNDSVPLAEEGHPKQLAILNILLRFSKLSQQSLKNVELRYQEVAETYRHDPRLRAQEMRKLFIPLAEKWHELGGSLIYKHLPLDALPAADNLKKMLWGALKDSLLPDLLQITYSQVVAWSLQFHDSLASLDKCYHTTHPQWACHVTAQYVTDFIRHYLSTSSEEVAKVGFGALKEHFLQASMPPNDILKESLKQDKAAFEALISKNARSLEKCYDPEINPIWTGLTSHIEGILAKFMAEFSQSVHEIEKNHPDFMIDLATALMKETADYFKAVNTVTQEANETRGHLLHPTTILASLGTDLHPGIPLDPSASPEEKDRIRLQGQFIPLAAKILEVANLSIKDLPIPPAFKEQIGELLMGKSLPLALLRATGKGFQNQVRDSLMLNFVQTLYAAVHRVDLPKEEMQQEVKGKLGPKQKHLNETCGALVLELIKLIPDTMVQYVFMKEKVKSMSAEAVGELMMPHLSRWTLLQLIDTAIYHGLPQFHPAKWEGKTGRERLVPRQAFVGSDGVKELKEVNKFAFNFPRTAAQIQADSQAKLKEGQNVRKQLRSAFTRTISDQLRAKAWSFIKTLWNSLQVYLNDFVERQFPEKGIKIKTFIDKVCYLVFFRFLGPIVEFILSPITYILQYAIEKIYIDRRADDIIENLHSEALEHLFYKWIDSVMDTLVRLHRQKQR